MDQQRMAELVRLMVENCNCRAAWELSRFAEREGSLARELVPAFTKSLRSLETRDPAAMGLEAIGPGAADAIPELVRAMQYKPDDFCINPFVRALGAIGPAAKEAVPALMAALEYAHQDGGWLVCRDAAEALGKIGAKQAIPLIRKLLDPEDSHFKAALDSSSEFPEVMRYREELTQSAEEALARLT